MKFDIKTLPLCPVKNKVISITNSVKKTGSLSGPPKFFHFFSSLKYLRNPLALLWNKANKQQVIEFQRIIKIKNDELHQIASCIAS